MIIVLNKVRMNDMENMKGIEKTFIEYKCRGTHDSF